MFKCAKWIFLSHLSADFLYLANLGRLSASLEFHRAIFIFLHLHRPTVKFAKSARRNMAQSVGRKFSIDPCWCFEVRALRQHCGYQPPKPSFADDVHVFPMLDSVPWLPIRSRRTIENPKPYYLAYLMETVSRVQRLSRVGEPIDYWSKSWSSFLQTV